MFYSKGKNNPEIVRYWILPKWQPLWNSRWGFSLMFLQHSAVPRSSHTDHLKFTRCHKCLFPASEAVVCVFCPECCSISLVLLGESPMHPFTVQPRTLSFSSVFTDHLPGDGASHPHTATPRTLKGLLFSLCPLMESNTQFWSGSLIPSSFG